jgi:LemA protein
VETVKAYIKHERETLEAVIAARSHAQQAEQRAAATPEDASAMAGLVGAERALTGALGRLFALSEAYPDLKANQNMQALQEELGSTENRIAFARQAYNDAVMRYNTYRESFPQNQIAGAFRFREAPLFEIDATVEREVPRVSFER